MSIQIKNNYYSGEWYSGIIKTGTIEYVTSSGTITTDLIVKIPLPNNYTSAFLAENLKSYGVSASILYTNGHQFRGVYVGAKEERNENWGKKGKTYYTFYSKYASCLKGYFGT